MWWPVSSEGGKDIFRTFGVYSQAVFRIWSLLTYNNQASEDLFKSVQFPVQRQCLNTCLWELLNIGHFNKEKSLHAFSFSIVFRKIPLLPFIVATLSLSWTNICARCPGFTREQTPPRHRAIQITLPSHCLVFALCHFCARTLCPRAANCLNSNSYFYQESCSEN